MSAYFIVYLKVTDSAQFMNYFQAVMPVIECRGGHLIAQGTPEILEGMLQFEQAVVFEWPSRQAFLDYWHSEEYAEIKLLRERAAEFHGVLIEGSQYL
jgi:uncharacterized protein (DUF1330 family)